MTQETTEQTNLTLEEREQALLAREQALAQREKQEALQRGLSARGLPPALTPFLGSGPECRLGRGRPDRGAGPPAHDAPNRIWSPTASPRRSSEAGQSSHGAEKCVMRNS